jgi:acetoin utilization deacetylase AcuC-like enzyme
MILYYHPDCVDYKAVGHPERPERVLQTAAYLEENFPSFEWKTPELAKENTLKLAHTQKHLQRLLEPEDFDGDTPYYEGIYDIARHATGAALGAVESALAGHSAFSLMRPPGHHATQEQAMGFCYLNHIAIAALHARQQGVEKVAVWDFDVHHGNGTEAILKEHPAIQFISVHQNPGYPGTGVHSAGNCRNYPLPPGTEVGQYMETLKVSWEEVLRFEPDLLLVSAGFDGYRGDPITQMTLRQEDFSTLGQWIASADIPTAAILEGGYSSDLPNLIGSFFEGWTHV